jgi:hypothetical protein
MAEEIVMAKATVYYFTFCDRDTGETVRPRRAGTLEAIRDTGLARVNLLRRTAVEVEEAELDDAGLYPRRERGPVRVEGCKRGIHRQQDATDRRGAYAAAREAACRASAYASTRKPARPAGMGAWTWAAPAGAGYVALSSTVDHHAWAPTVVCTSR